MGGALDVKVERFGPDPRRLHDISRDLLRRDRIRRFAKTDRLALLSIGVDDREEALDGADGKAALPSDSGRFRATVFDYAANATLFVSGDIDAPDEVDVEERGIQPPPSPDEFEAAVRVVAEDEAFGGRLSRKDLRPYRPMPPIVVPEDTEHRVVTVGLVPARGMQGHEIVGVDMIDRRVVRFEGGAPQGSAAHNPICGQPDAGQTFTPKGTAGQVWVNVFQGGNQIWRFLAVRPAASSGTNGSGVELRYVDFKGKRVLYRGHVPILNVKYDGNACGPYLDWQWQEGMLKAPGTNVGQGFRLGSAPATTILDTGSDTGDFLGVAIYVQGQEVVLVSEMEAGWYRYVSEWRLGANGTIRPRFGFGATTSSCVCSVHHHHAYWRLDFDIRTPGGNVVREFNDPPLIGGSNWHVKRYETQRPRSPSQKRKWRVENASTGEAYEIVPGPNDGVATSSADWPFPQGDVWLTRYKGTEIDNGVWATGPPYEANIGNFVNGEIIENEDVVLWYGAHSTHDVAHEAPGEFGHRVGPDLNLVKW